MNCGRRRLFHEVPENIPPSPLGEVFFITVCCRKRGRNQLADAAVWQALTESVRTRESTNALRCRLLLAMPDHLHGLIHFPGPQRMAAVIRALKCWMAKKHRIDWQRGFFDHRLRGHESAEEKARYIRLNPVRAGLVENPNEWPFVFRGSWRG